MNEARLTYQTMLTEWIVKKTVSGCAFVVCAFNHSWMA